MEQEVCQGRAEHGGKLSPMGRAWNPMEKEGALCEMNTLWLLLPCCESVFTFNLSPMPEDVQLTP